MIRSTFRPKTVNPLLGAATGLPLALLLALPLALLLALLVLPATAAAQRPSNPEPGLLRVCADPDNMPLSNDKGEGFENKIAELVARTWDSKLQYVWWPVRRGYFGRGLNGKYCDIAIEAPGALDMTAVTKPYYRSGYYFLSRKDHGLGDLTSLSDPRLKKLTIGFQTLNSDGEDAPPIMALSRYGVVGNTRGYNSFYSDLSRPGDLVNGVAKKEVDVAIVWGPQAGYFVKRSPVPLVMVPLAERDSLTDYPFRFDLAMGVRRRDRELRDSLNRVIEAKAPEIQAILKQYNVPTFPVKEQPAGEHDAKPEASR